MNFSRRLALVSTLLVVPLVVRGQSTVPALIQALPAQTIGVGGTAVNLDLRNYFSIPGVTGQVAQFDTVLGKFNVELLANDAPKTVQNFLAYINAGRYQNLIVHRSVPGFVIQSGGYTATLPPVHIDPFAPVQNEFKLSNLRGTLAMAKLGSDPNSATSEWFANLADNSANLDNQNGGFTVFAHVLGTGMSVVDAIAAVQIFDATNGDPTSPFGSLPLQNVVAGQPTITVANLIIVNSITVVPVYPTSASPTAVLAFTVTNDNAAAVTATLSGSTLTLTPVGAGTATILVSAADTNGNAVSGSFRVTVTNPTITSQPVAQTISSGSTVVFSVAATGAPAPTYQWSGPNGNIFGATSATLVLSGTTGATAALAGNYSCLVSNSVSSVTSSPATLTVITTNNPGRLINLSVLTDISAAVPDFTVGTVIGPHRRQRRDVARGARGRPDARPAAVQHPGHDRRSAVHAL